ncbi:MAG: hypothetical protein AAGF98_10920 [Cyanobacteria bacterium P01_H01_bin.153]
MLLDKLLGQVLYPFTLDMLQLAERGGSFGFWHDKPELYKVRDGEAATGSEKAATIQAFKLSSKPQTPALARSPALLEYCLRGIEWDQVPSLLNDDSWCLCPVRDNISAVAIALILLATGFYCGAVNS